MAEVQLLLAQARSWAEELGKPVRLWIADTQEAFVRGIAVEFPGMPHRYCANHFLRDVAQPVIEADSRTKVQMRPKLRGLRTIEREGFASQRTSAQSERSEGHSEASPSEALQADEAPQDVVLDYRPNWNKDTWTIHSFLADR